MVVTYKIGSEEHRHSMLTAVTLYHQNNIGLCTVLLILTVDYLFFIVTSIPFVLFLLITNLTHCFHVFIYLISLHVSSVTALIIRRSNCVNTSSDMISLCK